MCSAKRKHPVGKRITTELLSDYITARILTKESHSRTQKCILKSKELKRIKNSSGFSSKRIFYKNIKI